MTHCFVCLELKGSRFITASRGHVRFQETRNSQLFENLNDAHILLMPKFATCKESYDGTITSFMRNRESTF